MANKTLSEVLNEFSSSIVKDVTTLKTIKFSNGKCSAHLYHLERQGDSATSRYIYRCKRGGCRHYSTFNEMTGRIAFCRDCEKQFTVEEKHFVKNYSARNPEEIFYEFPACGCTGGPKTAQEIKDETVILEAAKENLDWLDDSTEE